MNNLTIQEEILAKEIGSELRKSLEDAFVGKRSDAVSAKNIYDYVQNFLKSNGIDLIVTVHINGPSVDISFMERE